MAPIKYLLLIIFCFSTGLFFSQTGPGGVGSTDGSSDLVLWLNPDETGNTNSIWKDQSGYGFDFSNGNGAVLNTNNVNGYNSYEFNGSNNYFEKSYESDLNPDEFSVFSTTKVLSSSNYKAVISSRDDYSHWFWPDRKNGFILYAVPNSNNWSFWTGGNNNWNSIGGTQSTAGSWAVQNMNYASGANGKSLYLDNSLNGNSSQVMDKNPSRPFRIGAGRNESSPAYYYKGDIGEIIMYNSVLNEAQKIIVNNYLSAKYNFNLATNDLYTQDNSGNGDFDHNVAGIGRVDSSNQHLDSQGTGIIRISKAGLGDNKFLFWGEETKNATYNFSENTTNYTQQLNSKWRVSEPRNIGGVEVSLKLSDINISGWDASCTDLELVVGNNSNFSSPTTVYPFTVSAGIATATNVNFTDGDYFTLRYVDQIVWDGSQFYNGAGTANAPDNSTDKCLKLLVKAGAAATLTNHTYVREIEVEAGAILNIADGVELSIKKGIINNGTINLLGEAQLIQEYNGVSTNSGTGKMNVRQQGTTNLYNYNYWSAPVNRNGSWKVGFLEHNGSAVQFHGASNANPNTTPITLSNRWLYRYNAYTNSVIGALGWVALNPATSTLDPGIGYTMKGSGSSNTEEEYVFSGTANSGNYTYPATAGYDFLIGNPYPSALDAHTFIDDNLSVIDGTLSFYEHFTTNNSHIELNYQGGYALLTKMGSTAAAALPGAGGGSATKPKPTKNIAIAQGFFVNIENGGSLVFNNAQRIFAKESTGDSVFYRENTNLTNEDIRTKFWLNFTDSSGLAREILLGYDTNATQGIDRGYDAVDSNNYPDSMLWLLEEDLLAIQALNQFSIEDEIPLSVKIATPGIYTVSLGDVLNFPDNTPLFLKDSFNNSYYNLLEDDASFTFQAGTINNRFSIVYREQESLDLSNIEDAESLQVLFNKNTNVLQVIGINDLRTIKAAYIYTIDGKQLGHFTDLKTNQFNMTHYRDGVYVLKLETTSGAVKNIKFVKY